MIDVIVSDLKLCEVSIYGSDLRKVSDPFLANNTFFILPDFLLLLSFPLHTVVTSLDLMPPDLKIFIHKI
jgi:hypothetical protein